MFRWLGRLVTKFAPGIVIIILIISMVFALVIPRIEFKTNLNRFLPDNELVEANSRLDEYFGEDYFVHLILIEADNAAKDVLTPNALREQYSLYDQCKNKANVQGVLSIVSVFDEVLSRMDPDNYTNFVNLTDEQLENSKELVFSILNGTLDISYLNLFFGFNITITLDHLKQIADLFFDKDFDYSNHMPKASKTIMVVYLNIMGWFILTPKLLDWKTSTPSLKSPGIPAATYGSVHREMGLFGCILIGLFLMMIIRDYIVMF